MRMRRKPWARPELAASSFCYAEGTNDPARHKNHWAGQFARPGAPLHLELGCGKGTFIAQLAVAHPEVNYLALDIKSEVLACTRRNLETAFAAADRPVDNVCVVAQEICLIERMLGPQDAVQRIYINFCNPWPKQCHQKRRLTHPRQLLNYRGFLAPQAEIWFKTDDAGLFEDSLEYFAATGFTVRWQTLDLHVNEPEWNVRTEHEQMFVTQGIPIKALIAVMQPQLPENEFVAAARKNLAGHAAIIK